MMPVSFAKALATWQPGRLLKMQAGPIMIVSAVVGHERQLKQLAKTNSRLLEYKRRPPEVLFDNPSIVTSVNRSRSHIAIV